jgi:CheY-like chemotaxis protein
MRGVFTILLVDDNPDITSVLAEILQVKGYAVHAANSGAEGLLLMREHPVDLLLTDIRMPGMNGLELSRAARKIYPDLFIIFMTAYVADDLIQQAMAEGVKTVLTKPLDMKFLLQVLSAQRGMMAND